MPETRYARNGDINLAYQVVGEGAIDLVFMMGGVPAHVEWMWEYPASARFLNRLASFSRLIVFDRRGTGLSDRAVDLGSVEDQIGDVSAVMDAASIANAAMFGGFEGGVLAVLFAATHPERTRALITFSTRARYLAAKDYPWGTPVDVHEQRAQRLEQDWRAWGEEAAQDVARRLAPSLAADAEFIRWFDRLFRFSGSPGTAAALLRMWAKMDIRSILPAIRVPTLVLARYKDGTTWPGAAQQMAKQIEGSRCVVFPGADSIPWAGDAEAVVAEIQEFLTGIRPTPAVDRVLATLLYTDFVDSTEQTAARGDRAWSDLLDRHDALVLRQLERFRGRLVKSSGDGILATFDGPARAVHCAAALRDGIRALGVETRAGLHTGEIELRGQDIGGMAANIGSRVMSLAQPGEILVSSTVKDLVVGSGIEFIDRGSHALKGVPGEWRLFAMKS